MSAMIEVKHRSRPAYVYVRESTLAQVRHNQRVPSVNMRCATKH